MAEALKEEQVTEVVSKKKKWVVPVIIGAAVVVVLAIAIAAIFFATAPKRALQKQLDAADKYLSDLDYENAILAYEAAIEMDPKDERGYLGLANVYEALADKEIVEKLNDEAKGHLELGINVLEKGIKETDSEKMKTRKTELEEKLETILAENGDESGEGETEGEELLALEGKLSEFSLQNLGEEFGVSRAAGGVIIVWKKDEQTGEYLYGAVDSTGKEIAPIQYQKYKEPNDKGFFVMINGSYDGFGDFDYDKFTLYSSDGNIVYEGPYNVVAANEAYIVAKQDKDDTIDGGYSHEYKTEYYSYDGKLIVAVDCETWVGMMAWPAGFINGKSPVLNNVMDYYSKDLEEVFCNYDLGFVSPDGTVEWEDGDGIDVSKTDFVPEEEAEKLPRASGTGLIFAEDALRPINNYLDGYMTGAYYGGVAPIQYILRDKNGNSCKINPWAIVLKPDGTLEYGLSQEEVCGRKRMIIGEDYSVKGDLICEVEYSADYNGSYFANYGSKMSMKSQSGKWVLADISIQTGEIKSKVFDYLKMSMEKYWLIGKDGKWGYCDHDGNEVKMFDDAAAFYHGYAVIIENGTAYLINEEFEKVQTIGAADSSAQLGQVFVITKGEDSTYYLLQ